MNSAPAAKDRYLSLFESVDAMAAEAAGFSDRIRVVYLRNITIEGADTLLKYHLYRRRIAPQIDIGGYGTLVQDLMDPQGPVARNSPDVIVLCLMLDELDPAYGRCGWTADNARAELQNLFELLLSHTRATVVVNNFLAPLHAELGLVVDPQGRDIASQVDVLNRFVRDTVRQHAPRFVLADWEAILRRLGAEAALDARGRSLWRAPLRRAFLDEHAQQVARVVAALRGRTKKVLVLDCDNTLWGGVVGEDGVDGIALDPNQYPGRAFHEFHRTVLHLAERGVLIALCSKNEEADVFEVLDRHPASEIKRSHLSAWRVNWRDKASNIAELAEELNLGLDAFVFVDDNPVECGLVREMLPQVTVLQVPSRLYELPPLLLASGLFDTLSLTDEDRQRAKLYQSEAQRKSERTAYAGIDDYLASLGTRARIRRDQPGELPRIAQLTQKTNQFNLTTRRCSEPEVAAMATAPDCAVYSLSVEDRFGSLGLVGVLIVRIAEGVGTVDNFLMSCRALGRRLEDAMIDHCLRELESSDGVVSWRAEYLPTRKNAQVADFWDRLGFVREAGAADGHGPVRYTRAAGSPLPVQVSHIAIERI